MGQLLQELMATNPRAFDARAAIGLKMADRAVMLDNPAAPAGERPAAAVGAAACCRSAAGAREVATQLWRSRAVLRGCPLLAG